MWLSMVNNPRIRIATATIFPSQEKFHNELITSAFIRVTIDEVHKDVELLVPVEEAGQFNLADAKGESVLWLKNRTFPE